MNDASSRSPEICSSAERPGALTAEAAIGSSVADLYCDVQIDPPLDWRRYRAGLFIAGLATLSAAFISDHYGVPLTLMAFLTGLSVNFLGDDGKFAPGLHFGSGQLLKIGIVLLGSKATLAQIQDLGPAVIVSVACIVALTIASTMAFAKLCKFERAFGVLAGGAVAVCGASAALAIFAIQNDRQSRRAELSLVLIGIAVMSAIAMSTYPIIARDAGLTDRQAGFFLGSSIHDVAQALGAGYSYSHEAGAVATIIKLTRVCLLAPILAILGMANSGRSVGDRSGARLPWFVLGFFVLVALNSLQIVPAPLARALGNIGSACVVVALTAAGIRSPVSKLPEYGVRPLVVVAGGTIVCALLSFAAAKLML